MDEMLLYHTGFQEIREPDIRRGRANADFGQGFYTSADREFSLRWARERRGKSTCVNAYSLSPDGLRIKRFVRDAEWFDYIFQNRAGRADSLPDWDVIIGPIANDTIYDTWGITTSGLLRADQALSLLTMGPEYRQTVIKTDRAAAQLRWLSARVLSHAEIAGYRETVRREEAAYQERFARRLEAMMKED